MQKAIVALARRLAVIMHRTYAGYSPSSLCFNHAAPHRLIAPDDLGPIEKYLKNASDFCAAAWQLLGPNGCISAGCLEAN